MKIHPVKKFASAKKWEEWLAKNHASSDGVQLHFYKKDTGKQTMTYAEALDVALCFGWIDGQSNTFDAHSWVQNFTPRRKRSIWSKRNREHIARLTKEKRMHASGLAAVAAAKADGRWEQAYDSPKDMKIPKDFLDALKKSKKAYAFFETLNKSNTYAIAWRLQTAKKPETREKRMKLILEMMKEGKKFH